MNKKQFSGQKSLDYHGSFAVCDFGVERKKCTGSGRKRNHYIFYRQSAGKKRSQGGSGLSDHRCLRVYGRRSLSSTMTQSISSL